MLILFIFNQAIFFECHFAMFNFFDENISSQRKSLTIATKQIMINLHILDKKIFLSKMILSNIDILA
jgi:hypothetical protein